MGRDWTGIDGWHPANRFTPRSEEQVMSETAAYEFCHHGRRKGATYVCFDCDREAKSPATVRPAPQPARGAGEKWPTCFCGAQLQYDDNGKMGCPKCLSKPCPRCAELERDFGKVYCSYCGQHIATRPKDALDPTVKPTPQWVRDMYSHVSRCQRNTFARERDTLKAKCEALEKQNADAHQLSMMHDAATTAAVDVGFGDFETHAEVIRAMDARIKALEKALREIGEAVEKDFAATFPTYSYQTIQLVRQHAGVIAPAKKESNG